MQRSSETIGTIAAALAKAQAELTNPEKSLTATIRAANPATTIRPFAMRLSRAGSISCARPLAVMRSLPFRRRQSTTRRG
jgi:hypothetical protein